MGKKGENGCRPRNDCYAPEERSLSFDFAHHLFEFDLLVFLQDAENAALSGGSDVLHLGLGVLIVRHEVVENPLHFLRLVRGEIELFLELLEGDLPAGLVPGKTWLVPLRGKPNLIVTAPVAAPARKTQSKVKRILGVCQGGRDISGSPSAGR